jgi:glycosyltransferase involved in cell wall biosynthesis
MKIAIIHDWFINPGGSEKVTSQLIGLYPDADIYCLMEFLGAKDKTKFIDNKTVNTSIFQYFPIAKKYYRFFFPFFPGLISRFDLSQYDLIFSSSHSFAKGVKKTKNQTHICYIHTPVRYAWDLRKQYLQQVKNIFLRSVLGKQLESLQEWDLKTAHNVDYFIANSDYVKDRVQKNYERNSTVIYPPVDVDFFNVDKRTTLKKPYFLVVSRLVLYKRVDLIIKAFNQLPKYNLIVAGDGPQRKMLKNSSNSNITFLDYQSDEKIKEYIQNARATVFAANEDFGITPVESQACGTPVIALNRGGYMETVIHNSTGILFPNQTVNSLIEGIEKFVEIENNFDSKKIRDNSLRFGVERFKKEITSFVNDKMDQTV